jgi:hypothetical protein
MRCSEPFRLPPEVVSIMPNPRAHRSAPSLFSPARRPWSHAHGHTLSLALSRSHSQHCILCAAADHHNEHERPTATARAHTAARRRDAAAARNTHLGTQAPTTEGNVPVHWCIWMAGSDRRSSRRGVLRKRHPHKRGALLHQHQQHQQHQQQVWPFAPSGAVGPLCSGSGRGRTPPAPPAPSRLQPQQRHCGGTGQDAAAGVRLLAVAVCLPRRCSLLPCLQPDAPSL